MVTLRRLAIAVTLIGALWAGFSFLALSGVSLPYPDPTPDLLAQQREQTDYWTASLLGGSATFAIGLVGLAATSWLRRRRRKR